MPREAVYRRNYVLAVADLFDVWRRTERSPSRTVCVWGLPGSGKSHLAADYARRHADLYDTVTWVSTAHVRPADDERRGLDRHEPGGRHLVVVDDVDAAVLPPLVGYGVDMILTARYRPNCLAVRVAGLTPSEANELLMSYGCAEYDVKALTRATGLLPGALIEWLGTSAAALPLGGGCMRRQLHDSASPFRHAWADYVGQLEPPLQAALNGLAVLGPGPCEFDVLNALGLGEPAALRLLDAHGLVSLHDEAVIVDRVACDVVVSRMSPSERRSIAVALWQRLQDWAGTRERGPDREDALAMAYRQVVHLWRLVRSAPEASACGAETLAATAAGVARLKNPRIAVAIQRRAIDRLYSTKAPEHMKREAELALACMLIGSGDPDGAADVMRGAGWPVFDDASGAAQRDGQQSTDAGISEEKLLLQATNLRSPHSAGDESALLVVLGRMRRDAGELESARELLMRATKLRRRWHGSRSLEWAEAADEMATVQRLLGDPVGALELLESVASVREYYLHPLHPLLARTHWKLGAVARELGDLPRAHGLLESAFRVLHANFGDQHWDLAVAAGSRALLAFMEGRVSDARQMSEQAMSAVMSKRGENDPRLGRVLAMRGSLLLYLGDPHSALDALLGASEVQVALYGNRHPDVWRTTRLICRAQLEAGPSDQIISDLVRVLESQRGCFHRSHPQIAKTAAALALAHRALGSHAEALTWYERVLQSVSTVYGQGSRLRATYLREYAACLLDIGGAEEATKLLHRVSVLEKGVSKWHPDRGRTVLELGRLAALRGDMREAQELVDYAQTVFLRDLWTLPIDARIGQEHVRTLLASIPQVRSEPTRELAPRGRHPTGS
jgi:tetratricopeptide (TPR) repeat protein